MSLNQVKKPLKPQWLGIGAQKAGTSWLHEQLRKHPEIWSPPVKELHYFDHAYVELVRGWTTAHIKKGSGAALEHYMTLTKNYDWSYVKYLANLASTDLFTEKWYLRCFDRPQAKGKICGEITPEYCSLPEEGIDYLLGLLPGVRIIYIIRDPIERAASQLRMNIERRSTEIKEEKLLEMCEETDIEHRGDYATYVPRWKAKVEPKNLLIVPYGRIRTAPMELLRQVEAFIGLKPFNGYDPGRVVHKTKEVELPASVLRRLEEKFGSQRQFIEREFGAEFASMTR